MPGALTSLTDCKTWLGLSSETDDALIETLVGAVSQAILADLGRAAVLPTTYVDTFDGCGAAVVTLRQWPATRLLACAVDGRPLAAATTPSQPGLVLEAADPAPPGARQRLHSRAGVFARGTQNVSVTYRAGYEIVGEPATVPATPPYVVAARAPYGTWQIDTGLIGASAPYVASAGTYTFSAADAGGGRHAELRLRAGRSRPGQPCEWVADRYVTRTRIGQSAKALGGQETTSFVVKAMPDVVDRLLRPYRRVSG